MAEKSAENVIRPSIGRAIDARRVSYAFGPATVGEATAAICIEDRHAPRA